MAKAIVYSIEIEGLNVAIKNQADLALAVKETTTEFKKSDFGSKKYQELEKQLAQLKTLQGQFRQDIRDTAREQEIAADKGKGSYRALNAELVALRRQYKEYSAEERKANTDTIKRIQELDKQLKELDAGIGQYQRNVGNYASAFAELGGIDLASLATVSGAIVTIGSAAINTGEYILALTEDFRKLRGEIQTLTDATGPELDEFTARIAAIGETFEESQTDILNAANAVATQLDIPFSEALDRIEEGFIAGSNQTGEFLDSLKEYPAFFKEAGLGADALFQVLNKQATEGIFSDKGVDVVKEVTLRLRKNAKATQEALTGLGLSSEQIQKQIEDEGIGAAIATVAERMSQLREDSPAVGAALADIFGGPGEDAGVQFVTSLKDINEETKSLIDTQNEYQQNQQRVLEVNQEFARVQNEVAKEFAGLSESVGTVGTQIKTILLEALLAVIGGFTKFVELIKAIPKFIQENKAEITGLAIAIAGFNTNLIATNAALLLSKARIAAQTAVQKGAAIATNLMTVAQKGLNVALKSNPIGLVVSAIGLLVTGLSQAYKRSETFRASINGLAALAKEVFAVVKESISGFIQGFQELKEGNFKKAFDAFGQAVIKSNPIGLVLTEGKRLGDAFKKGYDDTLAEAAANSESTSEVLTAPIKGTSKEIENLNEESKKLEKTFKTTSVATDQFAKGSIAALKKEISDLQKELNETAPENAQGVLERLLGAEKALEQVEKAREELRNKLVAGNRQTESISILPTLDTDQIKQQTEPYKKEFEKVSEDLADKQVEAQKKAAEETIKIQEQTAAAIKEIQGEIFSGIGDVLDNLSESSQTRYDNEIRALEERYEVESEAAGRNARERVRLEEQYERERARLEEKAFEQQKKYRKAAVLASLAEGIVNILSAPTTIPQPFAAAYKAVRIGLLTLTSSQQIANINAQQAAEGAIIEMARGGLLTGATHMDPSGGIPLTLNGKRVLAEANEWVDVAEDGALAIINKRSTALHRNKLQAAHGRIWPGKKQWLSAINSDKNFGVRFAQSGAILQPEVASVLSGQTGGAQVSIRSIEISDRSVNKIAASTAAAVEYGARRGTALGASDSTKRIEREERLRRRTGV